MHKTILIDITYILDEKDLNKSTSIYVQRFIDNLDIKKFENNSFILFLRKSVYEYFSNKYLKKNIKFIIFNQTNNISVSFIRSIMDSRKWQKQINQIQCDVVYVPFTWIYNSRKINKKKIITIHDLKPIHEVAEKYNHKSDFTKKIMLKLYKYYFSKSVKNSDSIITISEFVKKQIQDELSFKSPINCVYNGVPVSNKYIPIKELVNKNYILYVNTLTEYKNLATLIKAFYLLNYENYKLVIIGKETDYWRNICLPLIRDDNVIKLKFLSNEELNWVYNNAKLFVTTSTHEGFGYTPIEAALRKVPVISTRCEALPEVTMGLVNYYDDPFDENELSKKIMEVLDERKNDKYIDKLEFIYKKFYNQYDIKKKSEKIFEYLIN